MLKKFRKLFLILWYFCKDSDNLLLYLMKMKAYEVLEGCYKLSVRNTEDLEDLLFHVKTYLEIPIALIELKYPELKDINIDKILKKYKKRKLSKDEALRFTNFLLDVEKQRAIERDFIFEGAKILTFGFEI